MNCYQWIEYFHADGWDRLLKSILKGMKRLGLMRSLRSKPATFSRAQASLILRELDFFDGAMNPAAKGIKHEYEYRDIIVFDRATDLMWQQSGSEDVLPHDSLAMEYIQNLNHQTFAGYNDWRLPTLEEAMSLVEPETKNHGLHIDPIFEATQQWIWTADESAPGMAWWVYFVNGYCDTDDAWSDHRVRAVRTGLTGI